MSENDRTTNLPDRPHAEVSLDWSASGAPGVTAESFDGQQGVPPYFALAFRDGARPTARRLFTIYVDARDGERLAERLEAAAEVLRSRRLDGVRTAPTCDYGIGPTSRRCGNGPATYRAVGSDLHYCAAHAPEVEEHDRQTWTENVEPTCDCADSLEHASGRCATRNPSPNNSEEADRDDA